MPVQSETIANPTLRREELGRPHTGEALAPPTAPIATRWRRPSSPPRAQASPNQSDLERSRASPSSRPASAERRRARSQTRGSSSRGEGCWSRPTRLCRSPPAPSQNGRPPRTRAFSLPRSSRSRGPGGSAPACELLLAVDVAHRLTPKMTPIRKETDNTTWTQRSSALETTGMASSVSTAFWVLSTPPAMRSNNHGGKQSLGVSILRPLLGASALMLHVGV